MVLDENGGLLREVTPSSDEPRKDDVLQMMEKDSLSLVPQIEPYNQHLLTVVYGGKGVIEWNPYGVVRTTKLAVPAGAQGMNFIPSNGRTWMVVFGRQESIKELGGMEGFRPAGIGEFDPWTGALLRVLHTDMRHNGSTIGCVKGEMFLSLSTDPKDNSLSIDTGSAKE